MMIIVMSRICKTQWHYILKLINFEINKTTKINVDALVGKFLVVLPAMGYKIFGISLLFCIRPV